jgi:glycine cleavage system aminomethyltransferase T
MSRKTSPLKILWKPEEVRTANGWETALTYAGETSRGGLFITDLSHLSKWALHAKDMDEAVPPGLQVPRKPGQVEADQDKIMVRLTPSECLILFLGDEMPALENRACTDMTDAYAAFALVGPLCFEVLGKLSPVDVETPGRRIPSAAQAPVHDLRCVIVRLGGKGAIPGLIFLGDRGYGQFLLDVFLDAGKEFGLCPAGWSRFEDWMKL